MREAFFLSPALSSFEPSNFLGSFGMEMPFRAAASAKSVARADVIRKGAGRKLVGDGRAVCGAGRGSRNGRPLAVHGGGEGVQNLAPTAPWEESRTPKVELLLGRFKFEDGAEW